MKTSDKLLLGLALGILGLFAGIHFTLYGQYRAGRLMDEKVLHDRQFIGQRVSRPACLTVTGAGWVNIYPSDSFYIELPREKAELLATVYDKPLYDDGKQARYWQKGDTLFVAGN